MTAKHPNSVPPALSCTHTCTTGSNISCFICCRFLPSRSCCSAIVASNTRSCACAAPTCWSSAMQNSLLALSSPSAALCVCASSSRRADRSAAAAGRPDRSSTAAATECVPCSAVSCSARVAAASWRRDWRGVMVLLSSSLSCWAVSCSWSAHHSGGRTGKARSDSRQGW